MAKFPRFGQLVDKAYGIFLYCRKLRKSGMSTQRYPWHVGSQLAAEVQAKDISSALHNAQILMRILREENPPPILEEAKIRMFGMVVIAIRAAYNAGANPARLHDLNLEIVKKMARSDSLKKLEVAVEHSLRRIIALVPDKNAFLAKRLENAINYISQHSAEELTCEKVAAAVGCSRSHLSTLFSRIIGRTFKETVLSYRMEKAKSLLVHNDKTITEVAFETGYLDPNYFCAVFRRVAGVTAGQYRKRVLAILPM